jgi:hypothetical protein
MIRPFVVAAMNPHMNLKRTDPMRHARLQFTNLIPKLIPTLVLVLALAACSSSPQSTSMTAPGVNLANYETFNFVQYDQSPDKPYESLELTYLRQATQRQMERRGFTLSDNPELVINFSIDTQEKVQTRTIPRTGYGMGYDPFYDVYVDDWYVTHETRIDQFTEGQLDIDLIDVAQRRLVWQGTTKGRLTKKDLENVQATLNEAVTEVFMEFPVGGP